MTIGVSTASLYPMYTEDSLAELLSIGVRDVEIFFNTQSELEPSFLKRMKDRLDDAGAKAIAIHPYTSAIEPFMLFTPYQRRFDDMVDFFKRDYFRAANFLDAKIVVLHGGRAPGVLSEEEYFGRIGVIHRAARQEGVDICPENVRYHLSEDPDFLCRMRKYLNDDIHFVFDIKQAVRSGYDPYEFLCKIAGSVVHIHVNDNSPGKDCLLPGHGEMDYRRIRDILNQSGADPGWVIEVYRGNFGEQEEIGRSLRWLKGELRVV